MKSSKMTPRSTDDRGKSSPSKLTVLSRSEVIKYRGDAPYVVISIRSPGHSIPRLQTDPLRIARMNLAMYDTTPEWEALSSDRVAAMTAEDAQRIARFVIRFWGHCDIVVHCKFGVSRSAGAVAGILDAFSLDASGYEREPYEPNAHVRKMVRAALARHVLGNKVG